MGISLRGARLGMPEQAADQRKAQPATGTGRREGVSKVVNADASQTGELANDVPTTL